MSASTAFCVDSQVRVTGSPSGNVADAGRDSPNAHPPQPPPIPASRPAPRLKHGLHAVYASAACEQRPDFEAYRDDLLAVLRPGDTVEEDLAEMMVMCGWKLRRLWRFEGTLYGLWRGRGEAKGQSPEAATMLALIHDFRDGRCLQRLNEQEAHLMRSYLRAESRLRQRQDERRKEPPGKDAAPEQTVAAEGKLAMSISEAQGAGAPAAEHDAPTAGVPDAWPSHSPDTGTREIANRLAPDGAPPMPASGGVDKGMPMAAD